MLNEEDPEVGVQPRAPSSRTPEATVWNPRLVAIYLLLVFSSVAAALGQISSPGIFWIILVLGITASLTTLFSGIRAVYVALRDQEVRAEALGLRVAGTRRRGGIQMSRLSESDRRRLMLLMQDRDFDGNDYDELRRLDEDLPSNQGATKTEIRRLPTHTIRGDESGKSKNCSICLHQFEAGQQIRTIPCLHQFHAECIDPWLEENAICPVCKFPAIG
mmetsp:Transcript_26091/g.34256  ORF Transcript_26091/g.34256 Transcript_26091/m.34256 type:complete len:218 (+) Transcript_26091:209-862(+)|eukprot:CAMPEP_0117738032 /NCGR_PEP_ID=MMETSP0947-20121206/2882_1 /TAXON_ID=44440 /ORGANISM="Chattonella subsalsa, Strain CCMP2191" /LENGTH=217 /DNA_ID=CAMNT_0005553633 /DNA_START=103 /DNA_END=756 /DNA_ORIENTATION=-